MEFWSALIGAVVGGAATFGAGWWQTSRVLRHERKQALAAAKKERDAARDAVTRQSAIELLRLLADFRSMLPHVQDAPSSDNAEGPKSPQAVISRLNWAEAGTARLLPQELQGRWFHLIDLAEELRTAEPNGLDDDGRASWSDRKIARAAQDVLNYCRYIRASLLAVVDGADPPASVAPPVLRRQDMSVWQPPGGPHFFD